jgi:hypothetical protein
MTTVHPQEDILQQYAIHPSGCPAATKQHISTCSHCQASVALYNAVFTSLKQEAPTVFDFNLEQLVLPQLPAPSQHWPWHIIVGLALAMVIGAAAWWFKADLRFLFNGLMPATVYLVLVVPVAIAVFQAIELFQQYQKLIRSIKE